MEPAPPEGGAAGEGTRHVLTADTIAVTEPTSETNLLNLLIVDDERSMRESCREVAQALGFTTQAADSPEHAYHALDTHPVDVVLLDLRLPGTSGLDVLREIKRRRPETLVIVMTGFATVQSSVQAMKLGAYDYITKPFNFEELRLVLERVTSHLKLTSENRLLREQLKSKHGFGALVGHAPEMEKLYRIIAKAAHSTHPVRERHRQGAGGALHPLFRPLSRQAFHPGGLRLAGSQPDRERAVRLRARRLHRRGTRQGRSDEHG